MTLQEIYDKVKAHLIAQGRPAMCVLTGEEGYTGATGSPIRGEVCMYRAPDGAKCAAGCLIPDEKYHPSMEGKTLYVVLREYPDALGFTPTPYQLRLICVLQGIHDRNTDNRDKVQALVRAVGREWGLEG